MITKSINVQNLCVPCYNFCKYCLLSWDGKTIGIDYKRSLNYAKNFYDWLKKNKPDIKFSYSFGYSMEHPDLFNAINFMQKTNSPGGEFLQFDGMKKRNNTELKNFLFQLKSAGIKLINLTFYGNETFHDKFANRQGDYALMLNTFNIALEIGLEVEIGIPVLKENLLQLDELIDVFANKSSNLFLFTPHSGGRGKNLLEQKISLNDYNSMSEKAKKYLNRNNNKTPYEWLSNPPAEVKYRTLQLSLLPSNIVQLENTPFEEVLSYLEQIDNDYYSVIPSFNELLKIYCDNNDLRLYTKKDLYRIYRSKFIDENKLKILDVTDERYSGSFRY